MCVDGGVSDGTPEAGGSSRRAHLAVSVRVLPRQTKVQHVHLLTVVRMPTHGEVGLEDDRTQSVMG